MNIKESEYVMETRNTKEQAFDCFYDWKDEYDDIACIFVVDEDNNIIITNVTLDEDEEEYYDTYDIEMGFDPYAGCYTYDC